MIFEMEFLSAMRYSAETIFLRTNMNSGYLIRLKGQAYYIAPLQPPTLASVRTWGIQQELVV
jgi:hypothetical protein